MCEDKMHVWQASEEPYDTIEALIKQTQITLTRLARTVSKPEPDYQEKEWNTVEVSTMIHTNFTSFVMVPRRGGRE